MIWPRAEIEKYYRLIFGSKFAFEIIWLLENAKLLSTCQKELLGNFEVHQVGLHGIFRIISWLRANFDTFISTFTLTFLQSCMARSWNVLLKFPISVKIFAYFLVNAAMYRCLIVQLNFNEFPTPKTSCFYSMLDTPVTIISHKKFANCWQSKIKASL